MAKNNVSFNVIVGYYVNLVPQLIMDIMPLALMIAVLILLTVLERQQELTAFKAGGISLYRVVVPILLVGSLVAGAMWFLSESVVPKSNRKAKRLLDTIKGREMARSYSAGGRQWLLSRDDESFYSFLQFDETDQSMVRFTKLTIDESMELRFHLFAPRVTFTNGSWIAQSGLVQEASTRRTREFEMITGPMEVGIPEGPEYFAHERLLPAEMSVKELRSHINELISSGHYPARLIVRWHQKLAYPLSAFLMVFLALPFGLNRGGRRVTTMQGVALALVLGIIYYVSVAFFGKLGEAEVLPAVHRRLGSRHSRFPLRHQPSHHAPNLIDTSRFHRKGRKGHRFAIPSHKATAIVEWALPFRELVEQLSVVRRGCVALGARTNGAEGAMSACRHQIRQANRPPADGIGV